MDQDVVLFESILVGNNRIRDPEISAKLPALKLQALAFSQRLLHNTYDVALAMAGLIVNVCHLGSDLDQH